MSGSVHNFLQLFRSCVIAIHAHKRNWGGEAEMLGSDNTIDGNNHVEDVTKT